jgi:hypothetical protein
MEYDCNKLDDLYTKYSKVYVVYFTSFNGKVNTIYVELNKHPMIKMVKNDVSYVSSNLLFVQINSDVKDTVYVYVLMVPDNPVDAQDDEEIKEQFKRFIDNIKPGDFR